MSVASRTYRTCLCYTVHILACRCRPPRVPTWRRSRSKACTRTSTHGKPKTTRRVHTTCYLPAHTYCLEYVPYHLLPTCSHSLPRVHYHAHMHVLLHTLLSLTNSSGRFSHGYLLTDVLVTRRVRSSRDCAMAPSHLSATPPPSRRRASYCLPSYCLLLTIVRATYHLPRNLPLT